jgi:hypothetical protein
VELMTVAAAAVIARTESRLNELMGKSLSDKAWLTRVYGGGVCLANAAFTRGMTLSTLAGFALFA